MTLRQLVAAIQTAIRAMEWGVSGVKVFASDSVRVTVGPAPEAVYKLRMPVCLISPMDATTDPEHGEAPGLMVQRITVTLVHTVRTDQFGEAALLGGNIADVNASAGKGLLALETELFAAIQLLTEDDGINIQFVAASQIAASLDDAVGYMVTRGYAFEAVITTTESP